MKTIILSLALLLTTSFSKNNVESQFALGRFTVYYQDGEYIVLYEGNVHECITKKFIDNAFKCDTVQLPPIEDLTRVIEESTNSINKSPGNIEKI